MSDNIKVKPKLNDFVINYSVDGKNYKKQLYY